MANSSPDEKQDNPLQHKTEESDNKKSVEKVSSPLSQQDFRHRIVLVDTSSSMAGFTVAAKGEVQEHDSFDRGMNAPIETRGPRLPKVARHVADGGSEFPKNYDTSTQPQVSTATVVSTTNSSSLAILRLGKHLSSTSSAGLTQTSRSQSSLTPASPTTTTITTTTTTTPTTQYNRRLPSSSQHPNFAALFAARNSKVTSSASQDTNTSMSVEKVLPDQQVKAAAAAAAAKKAKRKRTPQRKSGQTSGRWTNEEHCAFLDGLKEFGREWKKVATRIPTRTSAQIRSHAQKYFAKLQREQDTSMNLSAASGACAAGELLTSERSSTAAAAAAGLAPATPVAPSVQKNIERLMTDPQAVQREVEQTLRALRERYRLLQSQLERQQERGHSPLGAPRKPVLLQQEQPLLAPEVEVSSVGSRKRSLQDMEGSTSSQQQQQQQLNQHPQENHNQDDHSSVTTNISASVASLGNEELIALHVLGGALPRSESNASLGTLQNNNNVGSVSSSHNGGGGGGGAIRQESPASSQQDSN